MAWTTTYLADGNAVCDQSLRIYTGLLGQIGDIIMFTATARRLRELFPKSRITFAVSARYQEAGALVSGLPYIDRLFVARHYFERLTPEHYPLWEAGWPIDLRGDDEVTEQREHDLVFETRPRHRHPNWWEYGHQVEEAAHRIGVPGPIDCRTEICIPKDTWIPEETKGKIVLHNDPAIDPRKAWSWEQVRRLVASLGEGQVVVLGNPGPPVSGAHDLRGHTTLAQAAAIIARSQCYVGIDSGLMWVAGSLRVPTVGLYGTAYLPNCQAVQPVNPYAVYLQVEGTPEGIAWASVRAAVAKVLSQQ